MQFTTFFTVLAIATGMVAADSLDSKCSNNQKAACCNTAEGGSENSIPVLSSILGGSCTLPIASDQCAQGSPACCDTDGQNGLINVGSVCAPITA